MITINGVEYHAIPSDTCDVYNIPCHFLFTSKVKNGICGQLCNTSYGNPADVVFIHPDDYHKYVAARLKS